MSHHAVRSAHPAQPETTPTPQAAHGALGEPNVTLTQMRDAVEAIIVQGELLNRAALADAGPRGVEARVGVPIQTAVMRSLADAIDRGEANHEIVSAFVSALSRIADSAGAMLLNRKGRVQDGLFLLDHAVRRLPAIVDGEPVLRAAMPRPQSRTVSN
jgi:hypothetical protein